MTFEHQVEFSKMVYNFNPTAENSPNLGVNHQLEVMRQVFITSHTELLLFMPSPYLPGTIFAPWYGEVCW